MTFTNKFRERVLVFFLTKYKQIFLPGLQAVLIFIIWSNDKDMGGAFIKKHKRYVIIIKWFSKNYQINFCM